MTDATRTAEPDVTAAPPAGAAPPPTVVPGFDLGDEVGRGGMGVVHRARDLALDREVAVKLLQERYVAAPSAAARFVEEARITGQLQHPGIPAVYHVGKLADGRPFLAMKLIKGHTLADDRPAAGAVPGVFEAVCQAVGYAHSKGVIHRDLKPQNVMVGAFGEVQVMDWGLAKVLTSGGVHPYRPSADPDATRHAGTEIRTLRDSDGSFTQAGSVLGTPAFMPPEQAAGELTKIDRRADVFALGAMLCWLLTGKPPYTGDDADSVRVAAVRGNTADAFARLDGCGADPGLTALCKRCLAFDPADRPADAGELVAEVAKLRTAAEDRAKRAELGAAEERVRRRLQLRLGGLVAAVLLAGVIGTTVGLVRADQARAEAETKRSEAEAARQAEAEQKQEAEAKEVEANAVAGFFQNKVFAAAGPKGQNGGLGKSVTLREAIIASLPALTEGFTAQPLVEARLRHGLGVTFLDLGDGQTAVDQFERAQAIYDRQLGPDHSRTLKSLSGMATSYDILGRHAHALPLREKALAGRQRTLPPEHPDTLSTRSDLANSYFFLGRNVDAMKLREEILAACERTLPPDDPTTLVCTNNLAVSYKSAGRNADALRLWEKTLAGHQRTLPPDHPDTLRSMYNLASSYESLGRKLDALRLFEETLSAYERTLPPDHPDTLRAKGGLARSYNNAGRIPDAIRLFEETLTAYKRTLPTDHPDTLEMMENLANSYRKIGRIPDSIRLQKEALAEKRRALPPDDPSTLASKNMLAAVYLEAGKFADALPLHEEALATCRRIHPSDHPDTLSRMNDLALSYSGLGRHREAVDLIRDTVARTAATQGATHPKTLFYMWSQVEILFAADRSAEAVPVIDECVRRAAGVAAADPNLVPEVMGFRLRHFRQVGDPVGCRTTAAMWEKLDRPDPGSRYKAACMRAVAVGVQAKITGADAARLAAEDADRAMGWLTKAVAAGYKDRAHMEADKDLDPLRGRADFRALLNSLRELAPPPRPAM